MAVIGLIDFENVAGKYWCNVYPTVQTGMLAEGDKINTAREGKRR